MYLCIEEQMLPDCQVIKEDVMLRTQTEAASNQSHVLTDIITVDISPATCGGI